MENKPKEQTLAYKIGRVMGTVMVTVFFGCLAAILISLTYQLCDYIIH